MNHQGLVRILGKKVEVQSWRAECTCGWIGPTYLLEANAVHAARDHSHEDQA